MDSNPQDEMHHFDGIDKLKAIDSNHVRAKEDTLLLMAEILEAHGINLEEVSASYRRTEEPKYQHLKGWVTSIIHRFTFGKNTNEIIIKHLDEDRVYGNWADLLVDDIQRSFSFRNKKATQHSIWWRGMRSYRYEMALKGLWTMACERTKTIEEIEYENLNIDTALNLLSKTTNDKRRLQIVRDAGYPSVSTFMAEHGQSRGTIKKSDRDIDQWIANYLITNDTSDRGIHFEDIIKAAIDERFITSDQIGFFRKIASVENYSNRSNRNFWKCPEPKRYMYTQMFDNDEV